MTIQRSTIKWLGNLPAGNYTIVPNGLIRDATLRYSTKAVAIYLWSLKDGYHVSTRSIATALKMNSKTVGLAIRELIDHGWLKRVEKRGPNGGVLWYGYVANRAHRIGGISAQPAGDVGNRPKACIECNEVHKHQPGCSRDPWGAPATPRRGHQ